jgi:hypothetical protein
MISEDINTEKLNVSPSKIDVIPFMKGIRKPSSKSNIQKIKKDWTHFTNSIHQGMFEKIY